GCSGRSENLPMTQRSTAELQRSASVPYVVDCRVRRERESLQLAPGRAHSIERRDRPGARRDPSFIFTYTPPSPAIRYGYGTADRCTAMGPSAERRKAQRPASALRHSLNEEQLLTLVDLEKLGWELKFIRRPNFEEFYPVVCDSARKSFALLR